MSASPTHMQPQIYSKALGPSEAELHLYAGSIHNTSKDSSFIAVFYHKTQGASFPLQT